MKKIVSATCLLPALAVTFYTLFGQFIAPMPYIWGVGLFTLLGLVLFARYRPFSPWILAFGFLIAPVPMFLYEFFVPAEMQYIGTFLVSISYAFPGIVISLALCIYGYIKENNKEA